MAYIIRRATYFYATLKDQLGEGYKLLSRLARQGVNLHAFTAVPIGPHRTQVCLFPETVSQLKRAAAKMNLTLDGPHKALLVQGDDELGALARIHETLLEAGVSIYASTGVTDGKGSYGHVMYVQPDQFDSAIRALDL